MKWTASRADREFSGIRVISDTVQPDDHALPSCCARTKITVNCRHDGRAFTFAMPVKGRGAWLDADVPPQNRKQHVMADATTPVLQVVSSATSEPGMDVIRIRAEGPAECPPGTASVITISPESGPQIVERIPLRDWKLPVPSPLTAGVLNSAEPWGRDGMHPFCLPDLPARTWLIAFPACPARGLGMRLQVKAFPDVHWTGEATVQVVSERGAPARPVVEGGIALRLDGAERVVSEWRILRSLFPLLGMVDDLTRTVNAVNDFASPVRSRGLDSGRLQWREAFRWDPLPSLRIQLESRLFEQDASGLLGHYLEVSISGEPLIGASGEAGVLAALLTSAAAEKRLTPITGGRPVSAADLSTRYGIYLIAEGRTTVAASIRSVRPLDPIVQRFFSHGAVHFSLEGRSEAEFESIVVSCGAASGAGEGTRLEVRIEAPPDSPLPEPRDRKPEVQAAFTGMQFHGIERICGGVRIRSWQPPPPADDEPAPPKPVTVLPARMWPQGTEPGKLKEVPWCHE